MTNNGISNLAMNAYQYQNINSNSKSTVVQDDKFQEVVEKTKQTSGIEKSSLSTMEGQDVIMNIPLTSYSNYSVSINKSKDDMTLDEYKQYISKEIASLPSSSCFKTQHTGQLIIKDEAFERMKTDPEYEKTVMDMIRSMVTVSHMYAPCYGIQVIGKTMEETYGFGIPTETSQSNLVSSSNKKSYWLERHEKLEALYKEAEEKAVTLKQEKKDEIEKLNLLKYQEEMINKNSFLNERFGEVINSLVSDSSIIATQAVAPQFITKVVNAYDSNSYFL